MPAALLVGFVSVTVVVFCYWPNINQPTSCIGGISGPEFEPTLIIFFVITLFVLLTFARTSQAFFAL